MYAEDRESVTDTKSKTGEKTDKKKSASDFLQIITGMRTDYVLAAFDELMQELKESYPDLYEKTIQRLQN